MTFSTLMLMGGVILLLSLYGVSTFQHNCPTKSSMYFSGLDELLEQTEDNSTFASELEEHFRHWNDLHGPEEDIAKFSCDVSVGTRSKHRPTSVHRLKPGDIDVVAALGDSVTAAFAAKSRNLFEYKKLIENRGISWSVGGDEDIRTVFTLPNMLKLYNPNLRGFSTGDIPASCQDNKKYAKQVADNVAASGALSMNISDQAHSLVEKMKGDVEIDFNSDWKLVTLYIGGNDLCEVCKVQNYSWTSYTDNINETLIYLRDNLPNTLVNVVPVMDLSLFSGLHSANLFPIKSCNLFHRLFCACSLGSYIDETSERFVEYTNSLLNLLNTEPYTELNDSFSVVIQPFDINQHVVRTKNGKVDFSYTAPDCFHPNAKGHSMMAQGLWNNMFEGAGRKRLSFYDSDVWICPTLEHPYIYTYGNSDKTPTKLYEEDETTPEQSLDMPAEGVNIPAEGVNVPAGRGKDQKVGSEKVGGEKVRGEKVRLEDEKMRLFSDDFHGAPALISGLFIGMCSVVSVVVMIIAVHGKITSRRITINTESEGLVRNYSSI